MSSQNLPALVEFANNPEPRCPVVLVLDTSGSMVGTPIAELNGGIQAFADDVRRDDLARLRCEAALVTFEVVPVVVEVEVAVPRSMPASW